MIVPLWPGWIPGRPFWAYAVGAALVAAGVAILFNIKGRTVAAVLGAVILVLVVVDDIPGQLAHYPAHLGVWTNTFKALTMCGGAWIVAGTLVAGSLTERTSGVTRYLEPLMPFGRFFLPITVIAFGIDHFLYPAFVATLVPAWIPGHVFWTYFAGVALIAAGVGMIVRVLPRLASLMLGIMIFLWFIFLHIPRAIADPHTALGNEWTRVFEALAFSGIAFMLAALPASNPMSISPSK